MNGCSASNRRRGKHTPFTPVGHKKNIKFVNRHLFHACLKYLTRTFGELYLQSPKEKEASSSLFREKSKEIVQPLAGQQAGRHKTQKHARDARYFVSAHPQSMGCAKRCTILLYVRPHVVLLLTASATQLQRLF